MEQANPLLKVSNISFARGKAVLKNVSFELGRGEMLTLLGPSGSGKTSLLRCLNRLESIDRGEIFLDGRNTAALPAVELRRRIGMLFQTPALLPLTVKENIRVGPQLKKQTLDDDECLSLVAKVGLGKEFLDRKADALSIGEQQRVALAQALANRPDVLLLDEPTSALDPTAALTVENLIKSVHEELGRGTILVTHNVGQALRFNTQTLVLMNGEILARGNIQKLMNSPGDETLQKFFQGKLENGSR